MTEKIDWKTIYVTPLGVAIYPHLNSANTKFKKAGEFSVKLRLGPEAGSAHAQKLLALNDLAYRLNCKKEFKTELKKAVFPWNEGPDGTFIFSFKMTASGVSGEGKPWTRRPQIFDSEGNAIDADEVVNLRIGSGLRDTGQLPRSPVLHRSGW